MKFKRTSLILVTFFSLISFSVFSQGRKLYPGQTRTRMNSSIPLSRIIAYPWTWTFGLGTTSYFGQLCATGDCFTSANYQLNLGLRYRFNTRLSFAGSLRHFKTSATDEKSTLETGRKTRNLSFRTDGYELQGFVLFDFIPIITRFMGDKSDQYNRRNFFVPYAFLGGGALYFDPKAQDPLSKDYVSLAKLITSEEKRNKPYSQFTPIITAGLGCRIKVSEFFDVGADISYTRTFTDNLDDISGKSHYPVNNQDPTFANSLDGRLADKNLVYLDDPTAIDPATGLLLNRQKGYNATNEVQGRRGGVNTLGDGYFILNFRIDYTMANPVSFKQQRSHKHYKTHKGYKHHQFDRK